MLPAILDTARLYLLEDRDRMVAAGLPATTIDHIIRLRDAYDYWLDSPKISDKQIVDRLMSFGKIRKTQAYADLKIVKQLLGAMQQASKDYHQYRFLQMIEAAYQKAVEKDDPRSMVAAAAQYAKYTKLDKEEDERAAVMLPQPFEITDDPTVAGFKPVANIREKIKKLKEQYWKDDVSEIEFEEIEYNEDELFSKNGKTENLPK